MRFGDYIPYACAWEGDNLIVSSKEDIEQEIVESWRGGYSINGPWKLERLKEGQGPTPCLSEWYACRISNKFLMFHVDELSNLDRFEEIYLMKETEFKISVSIGDTM